MFSWFERSNGFYKIFATLISSKIVYRHFNILLRSTRKDLINKTQKCNVWLNYHLIRLAPMLLFFFTPYHFNASIMSQQFQVIEKWNFVSFQIWDRVLSTFYNPWNFFHLIIPHLIEKENEEDCNYDSLLTTNCTFSPVLLSFIGIVR